MNQGRTTTRASTTSLSSRPRPQTRLDEAVNHGFRLHQPQPFAPHEVKYTPQAITIFGRVVPLAVFGDSVDYILFLKCLHFFFRQPALDCELVWKLIVAHLGSPFFNLQFGVLPYFGVFEGRVLPMGSSMLRAGIFSGPFRTSPPTHWPAGSTSTGFIFITCATPPYSYGIPISREHIIAPIMETLLTISGIDI